MSKLKAVLIIVACIAGYFLLARPWAEFNADFINDIRQEYIIQDADKRIANYEWFYDQYEQIEATRRNAEIAKGTAEERGILMVLSSMIGEYNSRARMEHTRAQWMPKDLPYQIELEVEELR